MASGFLILSKTWRCGSPTPLLSIHHFFLFYHSGCMLHGGFTCCHFYTFKVSLFIGHSSTIDIVFPATTIIPLTDFVVIPLSFLAGNNYSLLPVFAVIWFCCCVCSITRCDKLTIVDLIWWINSNFYCQWCCFIFTSFIIVGCELYGGSSLLLA